MADFQLREPQLGESLRPRAPHLIPPEQLQLHMDPMLGAGLPPPTAADLLRAHGHMAEPNPLIPNPLAPIPGIPTPHGPGGPLSLHHDDGHLGVEAEGHLGPLDLSGHLGINPNSGSVGVGGGISIPLGPNLHIGAEGSASGVPGHEGPEWGVNGVFGGRF